MDLQGLAHNLRQLRTASRFSQRKLAEEARVSLPTIKNLEAGKTEPRVDTLQAVARALGLRLQDLLIPARRLETVRFRSSKRMRNREKILAEVSRWLDDFNSLEDILGEHQTSRLEEIEAQCSRRDIVSAAILCRELLNLKPTEPIHDICGLLEHAGIKIFTVSCASDDFFALSVAKEDGGPAIIVNTWERIAVERRIFSAAHELGHLLLHQEAYDVNQTEENEEEEQEANLFAAHFLMPDEGFRREWNEAAGLHWVDRVFKVKRIFRVSYKTVLSRLIEHGAADERIWKKFNLAYQRLYRRKLPFKHEPMAMRSEEPYRLEVFDFYEDRLSRLVRTAMEEGKISLSRGAEIFRIGIEEMQELLGNWGAIL
jgi:Zn-dependent peptidase ImmA (M78 family)/transcriptional regulator with XRE-family HTH domain